MSEKEVHTTASSQPDVKKQTVPEKYADATLRLVEEHGENVGPLTPEAEKKLRRKLYRNIMFLLGAINVILFVDKSTIGYAAILGLFEETKITKAEYNNLNTFFYVGYLAFQWPGHYLMQRLPFSKFVTGMIFSWSVIIYLHCVATNYAGLAVLRTALGAAEAVVVPAMEITIGMFFNRYEQSFLQPVFWMTCMGISPISTGFMSYGLLYAKSNILPWKLLMITTASVTLLLSIWVFFCYPSNPAEAKFLTIEEKVQVIRRVQASHQTSIEQRQFKKSQFIETMKDPVSWLFCLQAFSLMYGNNLMYGQKNLLIISVGIDQFGSTLVSVAGGAFSMACCLVAALALRRWPSNIAFHASPWCILAAIGGIGMVSIPWDRYLPLLACMSLSAYSYGVTYIIALGWTNSSAAGYTKKLTRNVMFMLGYSIGNLISPQIWVPSAYPRYYGAWISMILISWIGTPSTLLIIRYILKKRNAERLQWISELSEDERQQGFVEEVEEDGQVIRRKVDIAMLDLTDLQNKFFIYPI